MNPALSVILFTSASGAGYGLLFATAVLVLLERFPAGSRTAVAALALALALITAGLLSSTLHLGRPERAWRAFSQWRSSWLSREGISAILTYAPHLALAALLLTGRADDGAVKVLALASAAGALLTVLCTAMIYASLRSVRHWHHGLVPPVYLAIGAMSGLYWLLAVLRLAGTPAHGVAVFAALALIIAWTLKWAYWRDTQARSGSDIGSATGLPGEVHAFDPPHTENNYLLDEMGFRIGRKHARRLRRIAVAGGALTPLALTVAQLWWAPLAVLAALCVSLGVAIERWLFFAEAEHTVTLYYR